MSNPLKNIENFIFDMDGTIINSSSEVLKCIKIAYEETNVPYEISKISTDVIGPPLRVIFQLISPEIKDDEILDKLESTYRKYYDYSEDDSSVLYEGIVNLFDMLNKLKKGLFIATNKPKIPAIRLIQSFKFDFIKDVYTIDKFDNRQINKEIMVKDIIGFYNLDKQRTVMIGDALCDIEAGKNNGILSVGALWGYAKDKRPIIKSADIVVDSVTELIQMIFDSGIKT